METELTKTLKRATHTYKPMMPGKRVIRYADEVTTPTGIVDSIRFEDYIISRKEHCTRLAKGDWCKLGGALFPRKECKGCLHIRRSAPMVGMCITCYECKISKSDFLSGYGKNFYGNRNYFVVPKELAPQIEKQVPKHIGILIWNGTTLRTYRECQWKNVDDKTKQMLLYNALKKWCERENH